METWPMGSQEVVVQGEATPTVATEEGKVGLSKASLPAQMTTTIGPKDIKITTATSVAITVVEDSKNVGVEARQGGTVEEELQGVVLREVQAVEAPEEGKVEDLAVLNSSKLPEVTFYIL